MLSRNLILFTWNLFVLYFGASTLQNKALSNQNQGHLGSRYKYKGHQKWHQPNECLKNPPQNGSHSMTPMGPVSHLPKVVPVETDASHRWVFIHQKMEWDLIITDPGSSKLRDRASKDTQVLGSVKGGSCWRFLGFLPDFYPAKNCMIPSTYRGKGPEFFHIPKKLTGIFFWPYDLFWPPKSWKKGTYYNKT